jgi:hypothetical protein
MATLNDTAFDGEPASLVDAACQKNQGLAAMNSAVKGFRFNLVSTSLGI